MKATAQEIPKSEVSTRRTILSILGFDDSLVYRKNGVNIIFPEEDLECSREEFSGFLKDTIIRTKSRRFLNIDDFLSQLNALN